MTSLADASALKILLQHSLQFLPYEHLIVYTKDHGILALAGLDVSNLPRLCGSDSAWKYTIKFKKVIPIGANIERYCMRDDRQIVVNYGTSHMFINIL